GKFEGDRAVRPRRLPRHRRDGDGAARRGALRGGEGVPLPPLGADPWGRRGAMKIAALGSGSGGNAYLVATRHTRILVDAGFSAKQMAERLEFLGVDPAAIDGIVVTHDHGDHTRGIGVFARKFGTTLYLTPGTARACASLLRGGE